jgi:hypothetical protein
MPSRRILLAGLLGLAALAGTPAASPASTSQVSIIYDDGVTVSPDQTLQETRHLGVGMVRIFVHWADVAPDAGSAVRPDFDATDPAAYPAAGWSDTDAAVQAATSHGVGVLLTVAGHAPRWAFGPGEPSDPKHLLGAWRPSASQFGEFVQAVGTRYSGSYDGLPAVHAWEIYNEPNFGQDLSPQSVGPRLAGADMYRRILAASWQALQASGHGQDTILIGALSAHGQNTPDAFGEAKPLRFIRELYCLDGNYRPLRGRTAAKRGCSPSPRAFRARNPGLFSAGGFSIHPYDMAAPPDRPAKPDPDYAALSQLGNLAAVLDRSLRADGSNHRYRIWNTEYGYITHPPRGDGLSLSDQAYYLNWAEYLSYRNPRIASFMQFLLVDPDPTQGAIHYGGFASGLLFNPQVSGGAPKPAFDAWRLPLYVPVTSTRRGHKLEVWGCVRPAQYALRDGDGPQTALVQFRARGRSGFQTVATVTFSDPNRSCYFDRRLSFPASGTVRLAYSYPTDPALQPTLTAGMDELQPAVSRSVSVTVR